MKNEKIKRMVGIAFLMAMVIVLQLMSVMAVASHFPHPNDGQFKVFRKVDARECCLERI